MIGNSTQVINLKKNKMQHTNLYSAYRELDETLERELIAAIKAHGGEYVFIHLHEDDEDEIDDEEKDEAPVVLAARKWCDDYQDYRVSRVAVDSNNGVDHLIVFGWPTDPDWPDEDQISDFAHGHLEPILDAIPETEEVKSVAGEMGKRAILVFSVEDVKSVGYNPEMTVSQFNALERAMKKAYEWNMDIYWDALRQACENVGIEPLNKNEEDEED